MSALNSLEKSLDDLFVKNAPALPAGGKKFLVQYLPWVSLFVGLLSLYSAYILWNWAHTANRLIDYANTLSAAYGGPAVANTNRLSLGIWIGLAVLFAEAILYIAAFPGARDRKKSGWDLLFYAAILNLVYGVIVAFTSYGSPVGSILGALIGSAIGGYFLFQIRSSYSADKKPAAKKA